MASPVLGSFDFELENEHVSPLQIGSLITALGGWLPAGSVMTTVLVTGADDTPYSSLTVRLTVNGLPGAVNVFVTTAPDPVPWPVPKLHEYVRAVGRSSV